MPARIVTLLIRLLGSLPFSQLQRLGRGLGWLLAVVPNRERHAAGINLSLCFPDLGRDERASLLRHALSHMGQTMMEMPACWMRETESLVDLIDDDEDAAQRLRDKRSVGRGLIIAAPHLGNWELGVHWLSRQGPITVLYRPPRQAWLEQTLVAGRTKGQATLVPTTRQGIKALYEALRRGETIAILPDQQPKTGEGGVFAPFFGIQAYSMVLLSRLAAKTGAQVVFMFASRKGARFQAHCLDADPLVADADPEVAVAALNRGVEACVRMAPEQYQWSYRRFAHRPEGGPDPYR